MFSELRVGGLPRTPQIANYDVQHDSNQRVPRSIHELSPSSLDSHCACNESAVSFGRPKVIGSSQLRAIFHNKFVALHSNVGRV
jgi:hypothetical protein